MSVKENPHGKKSFFHHKHFVFRIIFEDMITINQKVSVAYKPSDLIICDVAQNLSITDIHYQEILPKRHERYREMNVKFSSGFWKHQNEIPSYLSNQPRINMENFFNKMKEFSPAMIEPVQFVPPVPQTTFLVRGDSIHGIEMKTCVDFATTQNL